MNPHSRSHGSASFSRLGLSCRHDNKASLDSINKSNSEKILKYLSTPSNLSDLGANAGTETQSVDKNACDESPYKHTMSEIKYCHINTSANEDREFRTPKAFKKQQPHQSVINKKVKKRSMKLKDAKKSTQMVFVKSLKENLSCTDVNPDHLQLAVALSKSLQENNKRNVDEESSDQVPSTSEFYPSTQQKKIALKETLACFGFKTNANRISAQHHRTLIEVPKKKKNSKYQYITPILFLRTQEDRERLLSEKVQHILTESMQERPKPANGLSDRPTQLISQVLQEYWNREGVIFKKHFRELKTDFYTKVLNIPRCEARCGSLLKNWDEIPGREKSPPRSSKSCIDHNKTLKNNLNGGSFSGRSISPDLFESEDEVDTEATRNVAKSQQSSPISINSSPLECNSDSLKDNTTELDEISNSSPVRDSNSLSVLNITPTKSGFVRQRSKTPNYFSQSLLDLTPTKKKIGCQQSELIQTSPISLSSSPISNETPINVCLPDSSLSSSELGTNLIQSRNKSALGANEEIIKSKFESSGISDDLFENENGICTFESFSKENNRNDFEFDSVSDEENDRIVLARVSQSLDDFPTLNELEFPGLSENELRASRNSKSLNITEYINNMLNEQPNASGNGKVFDLSHCSSGSERNKLVPSDHDEVNYGTSCGKFEKNDSFTSSTSDDVNLSQGSQTSVVYISDEEINYSCNFKTPHCTEGNKVWETPKLTTEKTESTMQHPRIKSLIEETTSRRSLFGKDSDSVEVIENNGVAESATPNETTPKRDVIIKTVDVTPIADYDKMNTPTIVSELEKFGIKPLKRRRAVQMLKYIYESTHPVIDRSLKKNSDSEEENSRAIKRRKSDTGLQVKKPAKTFKKHKSSTSIPSLNKECATDSSREFDDLKQNRVEIVGDIIPENETNLIFERKHSAKVPTCRVPLDIAWHNLVSSQPELRKNILLYEPLQLEALYNMLKQQGFKYHIQDLLSFLDKKCITIRTNQNPSRRGREHKKSKSPKKSK